jgi:hypothetical protein
MSVCRAALWQMAVEFGEFHATSGGSSSEISVPKTPAPISLFTKDGTRPAFHECC